jgi:hypothetical protein
MKEIEVLGRKKELAFSQGKEESLKVIFFTLLTHMLYSVNESTLIQKLSRTLISGLLSSKKEVGVGYGKNSRDDGNYCNPSLGLVTKAKAYKGAGQE